MYLHGEVLFSSKPYFNDACETCIKNPGNYRDLVVFNQ